MNSKEFEEALNTLGYDILAIVGDKLEMKDQDLVLSTYPDLDIKKISRINEITKSKTLLEKIMDEKDIRELL